MVCQCSLSCRQVTRSARRHESGRRAKTQSDAPRVMRGGEVETSIKRRSTVRDVHGHPVSSRTSHLGLVIDGQDDLCHASVLQGLQPFTTVRIRFGQAHRHALSCSRICAKAVVGQRDANLDLMDDHRLVGEVDDRLGHRQGERPKPCAVASHKDQSLHDCKMTKCVEGTVIVEGLCGIVAKELMDRGILPFPLPVSNISNTADFEHCTEFNDSRLGCSW